MLYDGACNVGIIKFIHVLCKSWLWIRSTHLFLNDISYTKLRILKNNKRKLLLVYECKHETNSLMYVTTWRT